MDEVTENEIHDALANLGAWFETDDGKKKYLASKEECIPALKDLQNHLKVDDDLLVRNKLGRYKVLPEKLVPMFKSYREDREWAAQIFKVMLRLTAPLSKDTRDVWQHLEYLQDAKEAFLDRDSFVILMQYLVDLMEEEDQGEKAAEESPDSKKGVTFELVLALLSNLLMIPDPSAGHAGFVPQRKHMQLQYIKLFHDESLFVALVYFMEKLDVSKNRAQAWAFLEIFFSVCTKVDPDRASNTKQSKSDNKKSKSMLRDMLAQDGLIKKAKTPQQSRHGRFGTLMEVRNTQTDEGAPVKTISHSVSEFTKTETSLARGFGGGKSTEKKFNLFLDPTFVDLEEGSCREHDRVNPYIHTARDLPADLPDAVFTGIREFFLDFLGITGNTVGVSQFTHLVSFLRNDLKETEAAELGKRFQPGVEADKQETKRKVHDEPRLLSFVAWVLEFHRHHHVAQVVEAKAKKEESKAIDIAAIQGGIDLDMLQFVIKLVGDHGKRSDINPSKLVITLRILTQQIKTIGVVLESKEPQVRDVAEVLLANVLKDDVLGHMAWIMKNYKPNTHDPRVLTYSMEAFHVITRLVEKSGTRDFEVESGPMGRGGVKASSLDQQVERLCNCNVIQNLFSLLEKYQDISSSLLSILVRTLYRIIKMHETNIVVFFELTYFVRIERMLDDPVVIDRQLGKRYSEMVDLLKYILRQFFKCAELNKCVFVEMMFRKIPEARGDALLGSFGMEFAAILDNYENESYKEIIDKMTAGETVGAMKLRQKQLLSGEGVPWNAEEDALLMDKYEQYMNHPLCCDLLAAELPVDNQRTAKMVRKRLAELNLTGPNSKARMMKDDDDEDGGKKRKASMLEDGDNKKAKIDEVDAATLEQDLERLIDEAIMADTQIDTAPDSSQQNEVAQAQIDSQLSLEDELERIIDEGLGLQDDSPSAVSFPATAVDAAASIAATVPATLPATSIGATARSHEIARPKDELDEFLEVLDKRNQDHMDDDDELALDLERMMDDGFEDDIGSPTAAAGSAATAGMESTATTLPESAATTMMDVTANTIAATAATVPPTLVTTAGTVPFATAETMPEWTAATMQAPATAATVPESMASTMLESTAQTVPGAAAAAVSESIGGSTMDLDLFKGMDDTPQKNSGHSLPGDEDAKRAHTGVATPTRTSTAPPTAAPSQDVDVDIDDLEQNLESLIDGMSPPKASESASTTPAQASRDAKDKTPTPSQNTTKRSGLISSQLSQEGMGIECQLEKLIDNDLSPSRSQGDMAMGRKDLSTTQANLENELERLLDEDLDDDMD